MSFLFTMQGRITRKTYVVWTFILMIAFYAISFVAGFMAGFAGISPDAAGSIGFIVGILYAVVQAFLVVRRLHDIGKPGTHYWLFFVPFYNVYLGLVLLFTRGSEGSNAFGADPSSA